jgi:chromosome segregation ATPase
MEHILDFLQQQLRDGAIDDDKFAKCFSELDRVPPEAVLENNYLTDDFKKYLNEAEHEKSLKRVRQKKYVSQLTDLKKSVCDYQRELQLLQLEHEELESPYICWRDRHKMYPENPRFKEKYDHYKEHYEVSKNKIDSVSKKFDKSKKKLEDLELKINETLI